MGVSGSHMATGSFQSFDTVSWVTGNRAAARIIPKDSPMGNVVPPGITPEKKVH